MRSQSNSAAIRSARTRRNVPMVFLSIIVRAPEITDDDRMKTSRQRTNARSPPVPFERRERRRQAIPP
jgi:hypothetical protein